MIKAIGIAAGLSISGAFAVLAADTGLLTEDKNVQVFGGLYQQGRQYQIMTMDEKGGTETYISRLPGLPPLATDHYTLTVGCNLQKAIGLVDHLCVVDATLKR